MKKKMKVTIRRKDEQARYTARPIASSIHENCFDAMGRNSDDGLRTIKSLLNDVIANTNTLGHVLINGDTSTDALNPITNLVEAISIIAHRYKISWLSIISRKAIQEMGAPKGGEK